MRKKKKKFEHAECEKKSQGLKLLLMSRRRKKNKAQKIGDMNPNNRRRKLFKV